MEKTLGERCLDVAMSQLGVKEQPPRSNSGPKVREYLAPCVRGDKNTKLGLTASNWCMAFASWCMKEAIRPTERAPHGYRAGVVEAVADVRDPHERWSGKWHSVTEVRSGNWTPNPGDLAIYDRSDPDRPETSWWRHVNRVIKYDDIEKTFQTIGGNEGDEVRVSELSVDHKTLLGFIAYPQPKEPQVKEMLSDDERREIMNLVLITIDGMLRESIWSLPAKDGKEEDEDPDVS